MESKNIHNDFVPIFQSHLLYMYQKTFYQSDKTFLCKGDRYMVDLLKTFSAYLVYRFEVKLSENVSHKRQGPWSWWKVGWVSIPDDIKKQKKNKKYYKADFKIKVFH